MRTGTCPTLIVVGAILRFAVAAGSSHGVNVHVVGIIVLLAGVLGLLLSLLMWLNPGRSRRNFSATSLMLAGLARYLAGVGTSWSLPRGRTHR